MSRSIDADALIKRFKEETTTGIKQNGEKQKYVTTVCVLGFEGIKHIIDEQPTIEERKTGEWQITDAYPHNVYCSECHKRFAQTHWKIWEDGSLPRNFCPHCGARMEGEQP